jgi:hypothetical protein
MQIETDYSELCTEQFKARIEAFMEMVSMAKRAGQGTKPA